MTIRRRITCVLGLAVCLARVSHAQAAAPPEAALEMPGASLRAIAADFDGGRNPLYCYFGKRLTVPSLLVRIDSVEVVATPDACAGMGLGFIARIADRVFLAHTLRGLIESSARFVVVSAFYRTEEIDDAAGGGRYRAPRAFSVVRGAGEPDRAGGPTAQNR